LCSKCGRKGERSGMHSLKVSVLNELWKIWSRKKSIFFLALSALIPIGSAVILARFQSGFGIAAITSSDFPIMVLNVLTLLVIPLLVFMTAADMFAGEQGDKTIRIALTRPVTRIKVFAAKQICLLLLICTHMAAAFLCSAAAASFLARDGSFPLAMMRALLAYGIAVIPMMALGTAAVFVSQFFKNSSGALTVCILLYALCKLAAIFIPQLNNYSPAAYTDWYMLWIGQTAAAGKIASIFMFLLACCILFFTAGFYLFDKKEM
jgi:ABC-2 type transport system permease protein